MILDKTSFDFKISSFFSDYLVGRKTQYLWNNFTLSFFNVNIGVEQGLALSLVLLALYLTFIFHIFERFSKSLEISNAYLFCSYNIILSLFKQFGLIIEHEKTSVFHFSRSHNLFNLPLLDLSLIGRPIL